MAFLDTQEKRDAHRAFQIADDAWSVELQRCFGKLAGNKRYIPEGKGPPQSDLRLAADRREAARLAFDRVNTDRN
jgi:hypothetical protein